MYGTKLIKKYKASKLFVILVWGGFRFFFFKF